jgi:hypothetical protein
MAEIAVDIKNVIINSTAYVTYGEARPAEQEQPSIDAYLIDLYFENDEPTAIFNAPTIVAGRGSSFVSNPINSSSSVPRVDITITYNIRPVTGPVNIVDLFANLPTSDLSYLGIIERLSSQTISNNLASYQNFNQSFSSQTTRVKNETYNNIVEGVKIIDKRNIIKASLNNYSNLNR